MLVTEAPPVNPLAGKTYGLTDLNGAPILADTNLTVTFNADGTLNGSGGCNSYNGRYTATADGLITVSELSLTNALCASPPGVMEQEGAYINALRAAVTFVFPDRTTEMVMYNAARQAILNYIQR